MPPAPNERGPLSYGEIIASVVTVILFLVLASALLMYCQDKRETPEPEATAQGKHDEDARKAITFMEDVENDVICYYFDVDGHRSNLSCVKVWKNLPALPENEEEGDL